MATVRVGTEERNFLGRWSVKASADVYVRTAVRIVENLQLLGARLAQACWEGGADTFGEEEVLASLDDHLREKGLDEDSRAEQLRRLTCADTSAAGGRQLQERDPWPGSRGSLPARRREGAREALRSPGGSG